MSGIFGIVDPRSRLNSALHAQTMAARLKHTPWVVAEWDSDPQNNIVIGRTGIGVFNRDVQPIWNLTRTHALVMAGEIYSIAGKAPQANLSHEQQLLALYEQNGLDFARQLDGAFVCAILDKSKNQLVLANDRFAFYPLYYSAQGGSFVFAPEVKSILCHSGFHRRLDLTALAQYMRFQSLLGTRTFFEDIYQLPPATLLICDIATAACHQHTYWSFSDIGYQPKISFEEAVIETGRLLRQAVRRLSGDSYRPGVYLSGGLDSRVLLGMTERRPIHSFTYGARNCRDVYYAERVARTVGSQHHWFDLSNGHWVLEHVDFHLKLTEGFHSWIHSHGISTLAEARQFIDVNLSGWDGGTVMGHEDSVEPLQTQAVDNTALVTHMFSLFNQKFTWPGITEAEEYSLYHPRIRAQMQGLAFESFCVELKPYLDLRSDIRAELFYVRNHCGRLTQNMITFYRSHFEVRFPFFDRALFEFLYSLPTQLRGARRLYRAVLRREVPALANIPYDKDEFLPTSNKWLRETHAILVKAKRRLGQIFPTVFGTKQTLYADYENYLRHELRPWAEAILYDKRTEARELFAPNFARTLMARHCSGLEQWTIGKIAPLMTYEMMLRQVYDA